MYKIYRPVADFIAPFLAKFLTPNQISIGRLLVFIPLAVLFFSLSQNYINLLLGVFFFGLFGLFDYVDGSVARVRSMSTPLGKELDTDIDKIGTKILLFGVVLGAYRQVQDVTVWMVGFLVLLGACMKDYVVLHIGIEEEISQTTPSRALMNLVLLPEYFIIYGAVLNQLYLFLIIAAVVTNLRWVVMLVRHYYSWWKSGSGLT
jgi:archaetidylinositol phosphate synthase